MKCLYTYFALFGQRIRLTFSIAVAVLLSVVSQTAWAQVSVTATAGTLGPTPYVTLKDAFDAINAGTHQGAITIGISANTTEAAAPCVLNSSGAGSALYTAVSIRPTADAVTVSGATATGRALVELNGADNVTIDGDNAGSAGINRNLTFTNTAANTVTYTGVIRIAVATTIITSADNNIIRNCIVNGSATGRNVSTATSTTATENASFGIYAGGNASTVSQTTAPTAISSVSTAVGAGATWNNLTISNNQVTACARAIYVGGSATSVCNALTVSNNVVGSATAGNTTTVYSIGITLQGFTAASVASNTVQNIESFLGTSIRGLDIGTISASGTSAVIENNYVNVVNNKGTGTFGAYGINIAGGTGHTLRNNMVQGMTGDMTGGNAFSTTFGIFGIRIAGGTNHLIYHNSANLYGARTGTANSSLLTAAFVITGTGITGCNVRNNIFANTITGGTTSIANVSMFLPSAGTSTMNLTLNNNAYYCNSTAGSAGICHAGTTYTNPNTATAGLFTAANFVAGATTPTTNLRSYTSVLSTAGTNDNASYASTAAAPFISSTNLHLDLASGELSAVEQKGDASVGILVDIDGNVRPNAGTLPDMGADEVVVIVCTAAAGGTISPATQSKCAGQTATMTSVGAEVGTGIVYQWEVSTTSGSGFGNVSGGSGATSTSYTTAALTAGTYYYRLKVTCTPAGVTGYSNELVVTVNPIPTASAGSNSPVCTSSALNLTLTTDIGTTFAWSGPNSFSSTMQNPTISGVTTAAAGTYNVTVAAAGCSATAATAVIVNPSPIIASTTATPATICAGGSSNLLVTHPAPASYCNSTFTSVVYEFITNVTYAGINNTSAGTTGGPVDYTAQIANVTSGGTNAISVTIDPDSNDYIYVWIDWDQNGVLNDAGETYTVATSTSLAGPHTLNITVPANAVNGNTRMRVMCDWSNATPNPCRSAQYGEAEDYTVNVSGGVPLYTYLWNDPSTATTASVSVSPTATTPYTVSVTGSNGCVTTGTTTVTVDVVTAAISPASGTLTCATTSVALTASGGSTYLWSTGATTASTNATTAGTYTVTVTSANGCTGMASATVTSDTTPPTAAVSPTSGTLTCATTSIALLASGGSTYLWSTGATTASTNATTAGTYTVTVTGANGCTGTASATVTSETTPPTAAVSPTSGTLTCAIKNIALLASGGGTYAWSNGSTNAAITVTAAGTYTVTVTGTNGCTATASSTITVNNTPPTATVSPTSGTLTCATTSIMLTASGGGTYAWNNGTTTATRTVTAAATYVVTVTAANGCSAIATAIINKNTAPPAATISGATAICVGGTISLTASGGLSYSWSGPGGFTASGATVTRTSATTAMSGTYTVTVTGANGCTAVATRTVSVTTCTATTLTASATSTANSGTNNGTITVNTSGGTACAGGTYNYAWSGPSSGSGSGASPFVITGLATGWYTITVTDCGGNTVVLTVYVALQTRTRTKTDGVTFEGITAVPNPASEWTLIKFTSWSNEQVTIAAYSIDGKQVAVLFDDATSEATDYQVMMPVADLPAGIYTVVISTQSGIRESLRVAVAK